MTALAVDNIPDVIPYSSSTTYAIHQLVRGGTNGNELYVSLANGNLGNLLTDVTNWVSVGGGGNAVITQASILAALGVGSIPQDRVTNLVSDLADKQDTLTTLNLPRYVARADRLC